MGRKTEEIRKRIERAEEKRGRQLTKKEIRTITKKVQQKYRRQNFIRAALLALGIGTAGIAGKKLLDSGKQQPQIETTNKKQVSKEFIESLAVDLDNQIIQNESKFEENHVIQEFLERYNSTYNTNITEKELSYLKSSPDYLGIDENGEYVFDYTENTPVESYIEKSIDNHIGSIYAVVTGGKIITSLGEVNYDVSNINTKRIKTKDGIEYLQSENTLNWLEGKDKQEKEQILNEVENKYQQRLQEKEGR